MPIARSELVNRAEPGLYHCISRCVRRAFLCGDGFEHRRNWIERRLEELASIFAVDVVAYVVLHNHIHTLLWTDPERATAWSGQDVARRWFRLFPKSAPLQDDLERSIALAQLDPSRVALWRERLADLSWMMRCLKEPLARMANREDDCDGAFWAQRFKSYRICDDAGALTCAVYIDLNVVHAGLAETLEESDYSSVQVRVRLRQRFEQQIREQAETQDGVNHDDGPRPRDPESRRRRLASAEDGLWLTPLGDEAATTGQRVLFGMGVDAYLQLVDAMGRIVRGDKRGAIPPDARPILERLGLDSTSWVEAVTQSVKRMWGTTVGLTANLVREALRRGRSRVVNPFMTIG